MGGGEDEEPLPPVPLPPLPSLPPLSSCYMWFSPELALTRVRYAQIEGNPAYDKAKAAVETARKNIATTAAARAPLTAVAFPTLGPCTPGGKENDRHALEISVSEKMIGAFTQPSDRPPRPSYFPLFTKEAPSEFLVHGCRSCRPRGYTQVPCSGGRRHLHRRATALTVEAALGSVDTAAIYLSSAVPTASRSLKRTKWLVGRPRIGHHRREGMLSGCSRAGHLFAPLPRPGLHDMRRNS